MAEIKLSTEERALLTGKIQDYCREELDQDLGRFDAEFLLDFFAKELGAVFYNRGLQDARTLFENKLEHLGEAIYELEKPVDLGRS